MKTTGYDNINELTLAEASAWLTRLQDSARTQATEAAFKAWLADSPANACAFTRVNDVWELIPGAVTPTNPPHAARRQRVRAWRNPWLVASACAVLLVVTAGVVRMLLPTEHVYQTGVGAQQTVVLADNTRVMLNTDTRISVEYRANERRVLLERGEALFRVTENPQRPFIVQTGNAQVVDLGTVFDVRHYSSRVAVTLQEGKVWVGEQATPPGQSTSSTVLVPGERLILHADGARALDRPDLQEVMAWQHGQIYFNGISLADAVAELGRYGGVRIRIADPTLAALRVSGVFSVHDPAQFASAVASLHDLHTERKGGTIVLER